jgi:hypothetical protein
MVSGSNIISTHQQIKELNMSALSSLKLVAAKRPTQMPSVQVRRNKLIGKIHHQIKLAEALSTGTTYAPTRLRSIRDRHTGETKTVEMPMRVRQWWFVTDSGSVALTIKYGSKVLEISKGKNAIEVTDGAQLLKALNQVKDAVIAGELDTQIESAANTVKARFKK